MAKVHLDKLKSKYKNIQVSGIVYQDLLSEIIDVQSNNIQKKVAKISEDNWEKTLKKVGKKDQVFVLPDLEDVLPKRSIHIRKAAESGDIITDTLRDELTKDLRSSLTEFKTKTGKPAMLKLKGARAGRINPDLILEFEKKIKNTFNSYTKKDKKYGVPKNVHTIAVTEVRTAINEVKYKYTEQLKKKNPELKIKKKWRHNRLLSKIPRRGHLKMDGKMVDFDMPFKVPRTKLIKGKQVLTGHTMMQHPHDPTAPPDKVIGCIPKNESAVAFNIKSATKRAYKGDIIRVQTIAGVEFSITPNHPVLTENGWVPAGKLRIGDNIISIKAYDLNRGEKPKSILDIFILIARVGFFMRKRCKDSDFHGEGIGTVDIIYLNRRLEKLIRSKFIKFIRYSKFNFLKIFCILFNFLYINKRHYGMSGFLKFRKFFNVDMNFKKFIRSGKNINSENIKEFKNNSKDNIIFNKIINIKRQDYSGYVYNLHTESNIFYIYNNNYLSVLHNCNCDYDIITLKI